MTNFKTISTDAAKTMSVLSLAFAGDAYFTLLVRTQVALGSDAKSGVLHKQATEFVKASGQALFSDLLLGKLTEEEADIFRRAKNSKISSPAKNATLGDYKKATAFEAVIGFLFLSGQQDRLNELLNWEELCHKLSQA